MGESPLRLERSFAVVHFLNNRRTFVCAGRRLSHPTSLVAARLDVVPIQLTLEAQNPIISEFTLD